MSLFNERREYKRYHPEERREHPRIIVKLEAAVTSNYAPQISGWTRDISIKGVFVKCADKVPIGAVCQNRISLGDVLRGAPVLEIEGSVVRCDHDGVAIQFSKVAVDSLRRLLDLFDRDERNGI